MIDELHLINFKCFADQRIRLAPLTLLTGLNGMGKSSVIQSLLLLRQSYLDGILRRGTLLTAGELVQLGAVTDIWFERAREDVLGIRLSFSRRNMFGKNPSRVAQFNFVVVAEDNLTLLGDEESIRSSIEVVESQRGGSIFSRNLRTDHIGNFQYLGAERNGPRKFSPMLHSPTSPLVLGSQGEYTLHVLQMFQDIIQIQPSDPRLVSAPSERLRDQIEVWLGEISPGVNLSIKAIPDADLVVSGFSFGSAGQLRSRDYRATNVGFGLSYVLPVLVALLATPRGGLVLIENPEAHLHPQGQTKLGELCARAAAAGVQLIIETHSDHVMDGVRIAVRDGILNASSAAFHYFQRTSGEIGVTSPTLDSEGKLSEWPSGFFDQSRRNVARLLRPKQ
ncbi:MULTISPECIES: DUF3696 domain-containing protein [unclassified Bradyrhizobium]|uniref:DUF3696 domain-containing protein n=1 Tax=unclassified Bradyrhizobium TaxID=2631580 RepID=UPI001CD46C3D|nr:MULTISPECIES: DUF3696 domain-containing protein [unclassified Bradyrhizobium]MCA1376997.1 DUF3696 domain-containing protein [Bradyrhizobium sp. IC4060]MCA1484129.1 DUF3696 domain-containing protein [Bradyrhizobium sp. IC4061]